MTILKGKPVADFHKAALQEKIEALKAKNITLGMGILLVGSNVGAQMYAKFMEKTAKNFGFDVFLLQLPETATQAEVEAALIKLNTNDAVYGILPLMPMPKQIDTERIITLLNPEKDIDGLTLANIGLLHAGKQGFVPCTPRACMAILDYYDIPIASKKVVVIGRSDVVGKPVAMLALNRNATVTICHSKTHNMRDELLQADIIIAAAGKAHMVTADMVAPHSVIIDVGINDMDGKTVGDVDYEAIVDKVSAITPVPGGVGSVTTTMMLLALYEAYERRITSASALNRESGSHATMMDGKAHA